MRISSRAAGSVACAVLLTLLTACGAGSGQPVAAGPATVPSPAVTSSPAAAPTQRPAETTCNADDAASWRQTPSNFRADMIAAYLGVPEQEVQQGTFGVATCDDPVPLNRVGSPDAPVVNVNGQAPRCLVIGTTDDVRTATDTKQVIALCPDTQSA